MLVDFDDPDLDRLEIDPKFDAGLPKSVVTSFRKRMQAIRAALDERAFYSFKSWHYEKLKGRPGEHSIRLNDQWRLIVRYRDLEPGRVVIIAAVEDYH
jgi:proteic killer suppression protein